MSNEVIKVQIANRLLDELEELMRTIEPGKRDVIRRALEELKEA